MTAYLLSGDFRERNLFLTLYQVNINNLFTNIR